MNTAIVNDWYLTQAPVYLIRESLRKFALPSERPIQLVGKTYNDLRANHKIGCFINGHTIMTSDVMTLHSKEATTANTIYTLGYMNEDYKKWLTERSVDIDTLCITAPVTD